MGTNFGWDRGGTQNKTKNTIKELDLKQLVKARESTILYIDPNAK